MIITNEVREIKDRRGLRERYWNHGPFDWALRQAQDKLRTSFADYTDGVLASAVSGKFALKRKMRLKAVVENDLTP
jgi:hypothetical protein